MLREIILRNGAKDSTARQTAMQELMAMKNRPSQYWPGDEIPERHWAYRLVKKYLFSDLHMYDELDAVQQTRATDKSFPEDAPT